MPTNTQKVVRAFKILEIAQQQTTDWRAQSQIEEMQIHEQGYSEPGYDGDLVATGNWNTVTVYNEETGKCDTVDETPRRVGHLLEKVGFSLEWSDEWTTCDNCQKLVRTMGDSYSWTRAYVQDEYAEIICHECVAKDPAPYLEVFENNHRHGWTLHDINPEDHGYMAIKQEFEKGLYGGQSDDPEKIATSLRDMGITRFLFLIDSVGQFEARFKVLVHKSEIDKFSEEAFSEAETTGPDPAVVMQNALMSIPPVTHTGNQEGVICHKINNDGTVTTQVISEQEFVEKGIPE